MRPAIRSQIISLAQHASEQFTTAKRAGSGEEYVTLVDDAPEWVGDMVQEAHGGMLPDDYRYGMISSALSTISDAEDDDDEFTAAHDQFSDSEPSVYHMQRAAWLASHLSRFAYCDDAQEEGLVTADTPLSDRIALGWYMEAREVFASVLQALARHAEEDMEEGADLDAE